VYIAMLFVAWRASKKAFGNYRSVVERYAVAINKIEKVLELEEDSRRILAEMEIFVTTAKAMHPGGLLNRAFHPRLGPAWDLYPIEQPWLRQVGC
jgi:hypothetical protein